MKKTKKILAYVLVLCMMVTMIPGVGAKADSAVHFSGTWSELNNLLKSSCSIILDADVTAPADATYLEVTSGKVVDINLNGHTIDRNLSAKQAGGYAFYVSGTLNISGNGHIKGGKNTTNGGGFFISNKGSLVMSGGTISGNEANNGAGVYINYGGSFTMAGGSISENTAANNGGGVCGLAYTSGSASGYSSFTMTGGTICDNNALNGGGIAQYTNVTSCKELPVVDISGGKYYRK